MINSTTIPDMLSFEDAKQNLKHIAALISDTNLDKVEDVNILKLSLDLRIKSIESLCELLKKYNKQFDKNKSKGVL